MGFGRNGGKLGMEREGEELNLLNKEKENDIVVLNGWGLFGGLSKLSLLRFEA